jgi:predicted ABC-type ATPase
VIPSKFVYSEDDEIVITKRPDEQEARFNPAQPRDENGRWTSGTGMGGMVPLPAGGPGAPRPGMGDGVRITDSMAKDMASGSGGPHLVKNDKGEWQFTPERQALHDQIVNDAVSGVPRSDDPTYYMMGGGPGTGKSTVLNSGLVDVPREGSGKAVEVNADKIRTEIPEYQTMIQDRDPNAAAFTHEESSYVGKRIQAAAIERKQDIVLDGTGDSKVESVNAKIDAARANGYKVSAVYVTAPTDVAFERAKARALDPNSDSFGRIVPETVLRKTHAGVSAVFPQVATNFDSVSLWDNTGRTPKLLARGTRAGLDVIDQSGYQAFLDKAGE